jgi:lambda repressor-like predicted transcriptional regulator
MNGISYATYDQQQKANAKRRALIRRLRAQGWTLARIADSCGISKQRVGQVLKAPE